MAGTLTWLMLLVLHARAQFLSRFDLTISEEYNDNIFFERDERADFVTEVTPRIAVFYRPSLVKPAVFSANFAPSANIFARDTAQDNFGENFSFNTGVEYAFSERLNLSMSDSLRRISDTRLGDTPTSSLLTSGAQLKNAFVAQARYDYNPAIYFVGRYNGNYIAFLDEGGGETDQSARARAYYRWREEHNFFVGYTLRYLETRNEGDNVIHNFDIGDDFFSNIEIELLPTLTFTASTGISLNTGSDGPRVANNLNASLVKIWETGELAIGVRRGLTTTEGVAGISETTTPFLDFSFQLTESLTAFAGGNFSYFDTDTNDFSAAEATVGFSYWLTPWLSSGLSYRYRFRDRPDDETPNLDGRVSSNSVVLSLTGHFEVWPNSGLAKGQLQPWQVNLDGPPAR